MTEASARFDNLETVVTFVHGGRTYEIDHLGICNPNQVGQYVVYSDGTQLAEFAPNALKDWPADELIAMAKDALPPLTSLEG